MATFAVRFKKCDHQDGFRIIMTFEKGETARDMVNKLHPDSGDSGKYKICVIGFAAGASITTSTSRAENHGFEVELKKSPAFFTFSSIFVILCVPVLTH